MTAKELEAIARWAYRYVKSVCPYRTGNMFDQIKIRRASSDEWVIEIGGAAAPYAVFTNEEWISPRWRGKKNPNEKWIDNSAEYIASYISASLGGKLNNLIDKGEKA